MPFTKILDSLSAMKILQLIVPFLLMCLLSCQQNGSVQQQETEPPVVVPIYKVDSIQSVVTWITAIDGQSHNGTLNVINGSFEIVDSLFRNGYIQVDLKSILIRDLPDTHPEKKQLTDQLLGPTYFDTDSFPVMVIRMNHLLQLDQPVDSTDRPNAMPRTGIGSNYQANGTIDFGGYTLPFEHAATIMKKGDLFVIEGLFQFEWNEVKVNKAVSDDVESQVAEDPVKLGYHMVLFPEQ